MGALAVVAWLGIAASAAAQGSFGSPDGRAVVTVSRDGEAMLVTSAATHALGAMPAGPSVSTGIGVRLYGRYRRAFWSADSTHVALVGRCHGYSGVTVPRIPSCARKFVRVVPLSRPEDARSLPVPWHMSNDLMEVRALAFAADNRSLAAIVRERWSDCSYEGTIARLYVWALDDAPSAGDTDRGPLAWQRIVPIGADGPITFEAEGIRITAGVRTRLVRHVSRVLAPRDTSLTPEWLGPARSRRPR